MCMSKEHLCIDVIMLISSSVMCVSKKHQCIDVSKLIGSMVTSSTVE